MNKFNGIVTCLISFQKLSKKNVDIILTKVDDMDTMVFTRLMARNINRLSEKSFLILLKKMSKLLWDRDYIIANMLKGNNREYIRRHNNLIDTDVIYMFFTYGYDSNIFGAMIDTFKSVRELLNTSYTINLFNTLVNNIFRQYYKNRICNKAKDYNINLLQLIINEDWDKIDEIYRSNDKKHW